MWPVPATITRAYERSSCPRHRRSSRRFRAICCCSSRGRRTARTDPDLLNDIFRAVHTLKGLAGMFGMASLSNLAHTLENLLDDLRLGRVDLTQETLDVLFDGVERIQRILASDDSARPSRHLATSRSRSTASAEAASSRATTRSRELRARARACSACSPSTKSTACARTCRRASRCTACASASRSRPSTRRSRSSRRARARSPS